ncbi:hypothetical protein ACFL0E_01105 [Nanoarchaeota archaeon]
MLKKLEETWAETLTIVLVLVGFLISILLMNVVLTYIVIIASGFLAGRIFYIKRFKEPIFPFVLMIIGFLFGYILGNVWASRFWTGVFFIISFSISYYLHLKKILVIFKNRSFIR